MVIEGTPNGPDADAGKRSRVVPLSRAPGAESPPDVFHTELTEQYVVDLQAEAAWWDGVPETLASRPAPFGFQRYLNQRLTGDPDRTWYETIVDHGEFERGCVLGAGQGQVEKELLSKMSALELTVHDISEDSLARLDEKLAVDFPGRATFHAEDLNFVSLPENTYDLVVAQACIHHIVNLEHLAYQVNRALTPDGLFFMMDRVSESFCLFAEEKKRIFEGLVAMGLGGGKKTVDWPDREKWTYSPFEGVRSGEILPVFGRYMSEVSLRTSSSLLELVLFLRPPAEQSRERSLLSRAVGRLQREWFKLRAHPSGVEGMGSRDQRARGELLRYLDGFLCDAGVLEPGLAFAIYRKRE